MQVRSKLLRTLPQPLMISLLESKEKGSTTWVNVARAMQLQRIAKIETRQGALDSKQIFLRAIELDPEDSLAYTCLSHELAPYETIELPDDSGRQWTQQELILKALELNSHNPTALWQLADTLAPGEMITLPDGTRMNEEQLCMRAVHLDVNDSFALCALARRIRPDWSIRLASGAPATRESLYVKAMLADPLDPVPVVNLVKGLIASGKSSKEFPDGSEKTLIELILHSLSIDPKSSEMWTLLALQTPPGEMQLLPSGEKLSQRDLFLRAISVNPSDAEALCHLAATMGPGESVVIQGSSKNRRMVLISAVQLNPTSALPHYHLAMNLGDELSQMPDGSLQGKKDLLLKAIQLDPTDSRFYNALAEIAAKEGPVQLLNGNKLSLQQLRATDAARFNTPEHRTTKMTQLTSLIGISLIAVAYIWEFYF